MIRKLLIAKISPDNFYIHKCVEINLKVFLSTNL
jgi:hypothetical protein